MEKVIYIQLLGEGTKVYRPVPARQIENSIYQLGGYKIYDPEDEIWEFLPGAFVLVNEQILDSEIVLVAIKLIPAVRSLL